MEFEQNSSTDRSPDIDDATRLAAATRTTTLTPIHEDITPEDKGVGNASLYSATSTATPNVPIDTEATIPTTIAAPVINPAMAAIDHAKSAQSRRRLWLIITICSTVLASIAGALYYLSTR